MLKDSGYDVTATNHEIELCEVIHHAVGKLVAEQTQSSNIIKEE